MPPSNVWASSARMSQHAVAPVSSGTLTSWLLPKGAGAVPAAARKKQTAQTNEAAQSATSAAAEQASRARSVWAGRSNPSHQSCSVLVCVSSCAACCDRLLVSCWSRWESRTPSRASCVAAGINRAALSMGCSNYGSLMPTGPSKLVVDAHQHGCAKTSDASAGDLNKPAARLCACAFRAQISVHVCMRIPCANLCARVLACARECACSCGFMRIHAVLSCRGLVSRKRVQAPVARPRHGEEAAALRVAKAASS